MKKAITRAVAWIGCCLIIVGNCGAVELIIPADVSTNLNRELGRSLNKYQLNNSEAVRIAAVFEGWVMQSLDFDVAVRTRSDRYGGRETFYQELSRNIPIFMYDRGQSGLPNTDPVPIVYRRSANRFSFRKLLDVEAAGEVPNSTAIEMAGSFLSRNNFVRTTEYDMYGQAAFPKLIQKHPPDPNSPEKEVLILQQVRYRRQYLGAPVMNSRISIDYHPDTLEILGFKHYNWTPADEYSPIYIPPSDKKTRSQVEAVLEQQIREFWSESQSATLTSVEQMWFQTPTELIPILVCTLQREPTPDGCGDDCTAMVNIAGSEMIFYATPKVPPIFPVVFDCFPSDNPAYEDWRAMGSPSCWCNRYQCDGDADGKTEGTITRYRVSLDDLNLVIASWKSKTGDVSLDPCADLDHKAEGVIAKYRVGLNDLNILIANWKKNDAQLPGNCPRRE